jgi:hypothetical protein
VGTGLECERARTDRQIRADELMLALELELEQDHHEWFRAFPDEQLKKCEPTAVWNGKRWILP